jgi:hypothetical protein
MVNSDLLNTVVIVSIPALISGLIGSGFLTSDYFRDSIEPIIIIELKFFNSTDANLEINNFGKSPATNFTLFLKSFNIIKGITNNISVENINITTKNNSTEEIIPVGKPKKINDYYFEIHIPKLIHGGSTLVNLDIEFDSFKNLTKYKYDIQMIAKYDQGSAEGFIIFPYAPADIFNLNYWNLLTDLHNYYYIYYKEPISVYGYSFFVIFFISYGIFLLFIQIKRPRDRRRYLYNLFELRNALKKMHDSDDYSFLTIFLKIKEIRSPHWNFKKYPIEFYLFKNNYQIYRLMYDLRYNLDLIENTQNIPQKKHTTIESIGLIENIITELKESKKYSLSRNITKKE